MAARSRSNARRVKSSETMTDRIGDDSIRGSTQGRWSEQEPNSWHAQVEVLTKSREIRNCWIPLLWNGTTLPLGGLLFARYRGEPWRRDATMGRFLVGRRDLQNAIFGPRLRAEDEGERQARCGQHRW